MFLIIFSCLNLGANELRKSEVREITGIDTAYLLHDKYCASDQKTETSFVCIPIQG